MAVQHVAPVLQAPVFSPDPLSPAVKQELLPHLWPLSGGEPQMRSPDEFDAYFTYLRQECRHGLHHDHAMQSYADMVFILSIIRGNPSASLTDIRALISRLNSRLSSDDRKLSASIELAVRLWLMTSVRILMPTHQDDFDVSLPWPDNQSLVDVLRRHMSQPPSSPLSTLEHFSPYFNVADMRNIAGFRVLWTNCLSDHLSIRGSSIYLFNQVSMLKRLRASATRYGLLIPGEISRVGLDPDIMYRETADKRKAAYVYWRERLLAASEIFDRTKPSTLVQWWYDRRDMGQWWGFWLVVVLKPSN
ncbi:hypothetical protein SAPIO_CDS7600 [Scedosporium apiospermum]|uniref:Uncharacterized protein n=1 Tax=Pseudallescheria apiosperma TaxID=563466 RepID=A0A084G297_PSEDA|nr:uncharacterized protein SAPIO_CDS7600 [Scedosporium apiospermum]KEZ41459.1 hypothetical protein SAPIO_CDS7600 [Scedosporium apiospermum]